MDFLIYPSLLSRHTTHRKRDLQIDFHWDNNFLFFLGPLNSLIDFSIFPSLSLVKGDKRRERKILLVLFVPLPTFKRLRWPFFLALTSESWSAATGDKRRCEGGKSCESQNSRGEADADHRSKRICAVAAIHYLTIFRTSSRK